MPLERMVQFHASFLGITSLWDWVAICLKMILKLIFAIIFTNVFGVLFDYLEGANNSIKRKFYLYKPSPQIIIVFLFRSVIYTLRILTFKKKDILISLYHIAFILIIYHLIGYNNDSFKNELIFLSITSFVFWSLTYSFLSVFSTFLYEGNLERGLVMNNRELKMLYGEATFNDKVVLFFANLFASLLSINIYALAIITIIYTYFVGKLF